MPKPHTLKTLRELAGLTQSELGTMLAKRLREPVTTGAQGRIGHYETGRNRVSLAAGAALVDLLNETFREQNKPEIATADAMLHERYRVKPRRRA